MAQELLIAPLEQAEHCEPDVKAAALFHVARVMNVFDHAEAERVIGRALALTRALPEPEQEVLMAQAVPLIATVSPARALELAPSVTYRTPGGVLEKALRDMISHGHVAAAIDYLSEPDTTVEYPFDVAQQAIGRAADDVVLLRLLRSAMAALRRQLQRGDGAMMFRGRSSWIFTPASASHQGRMGFVSPGRCRGRPVRTRRRRRRPRPGGQRRRGNLICRRHSRLASRRAAAPPRPVLPVAADRTTG